MRLIKSMIFCICLSVTLIIQIEEPFSLTITSPKDGETFNEGDTLTIRVETSPGEPERMTVSIFPPAGTEICPISHQPPYECRVTLKPKTPREAIIGAIGRTLPQNFYEAPNIRIFVKVTATLIGLRVNEDQRTIFPIVDSSRQLYIYGQYSDGIERHLEDPATGTTYETSDPKVATVDMEGSVTAVAPGKAVITVRNGEHKVAVQVIVDKE